MKSIRGPQTSIIIPTYNNDDYTVRCLKSIKNNTKDYLIIWIDDASEKESRKQVRQFLDDSKMSYELIHNEKNLGFAKSVNKGLKRVLEINSEYCVIQNNDTEVYNGWLSRMIEVIESNKNIGMVGPITTPCKSWQSIRNLPSEFEEFSDLPKYDNNPKEYAKKIRIQYEGQSMIVKKRLAFFSVLLKTKIIKEIGLLSEEYGVGFAEDDDYNLRLKKKGYNVAIVKDVLLFHNHNTTFKLKYSQQEIKEMKKRNQEILYKKFKKGKYKSKKIDNMWDIEELTLLAKQQQKQIKTRDKWLKEKNEQIETRDKWLKEKNEQIETRNQWLKEKNEQIETRNQWLKDKNEQIEIKSKRFKEKSKEIERIKNSKTFKLGNLFFRSIKQPYKLIIFPYNFIKILLKK